MTEYTSAIALASKLITKKGREVIIRRENKTAATNEWEKPTVDNSDYLGRGVFLGKMQINRDGSVVQSEKETVLVAALGLDIVPTTDDLIVECSDAGEKTPRVIASVDPLKPGDENILFTIGLKG